ncbi:MAG: amidohydrolase [Planctomycetota bacterium]|nr:MAG: amidohydrolase [Planctomycetota bacterium]
MMNSSNNWMLPALVLSALAGCTAPGADLVLHGGTVWTVDDDLPRAEAVVIRDGRIQFVGSDAGALEWTGPGTQVIDLEGAFVLPGFVDNHVHFAQAARFLEFNVMNVADQGEFERRVTEVTGSLAAGEWILGGYWGAYDQWAEGSVGGAARAPFTPDIALIEGLTRDHPMFIQKFDGREFAVNRAALTAAGLDVSEPRATGVEFVRDASGRLTGIVRGPNARALFEAEAPRSFSRARRLAQTRNALREVARRGVTTFSDMSDDEQLSIYRELSAAGELTARVHFRYPLERWRELADSGIRAGAGDEWIRLGSLKGHIDGIMGSSSARFFEPYANDPGNRGRWRRLMVDDEGNFVEGQFLQYMLDADRAGLQLTVHAIGDEANHLLLDYLEELNERNGVRDRRFRLVHAQVLAAADFARLGSMGVVAEVQPFHLADDMRWMEERIGRERCRGAYAFKSIAESGAVLCFGTDWPGTSASEYPIDPMLGLYAAVARTTVTGEPEGGWFPEERISIEAAIRAYTLGSAYANFEEGEKGSITAGKLADLAVLSRNLLEIPPDDILETDVLFTIVGGRVVYERPPR